MGRSTMPGVGWLAAIGLLVIGALVLAFVLGEPGISEYPPDTPEAAAQTYIQALFDGDGPAARDVVVPEQRFRCRSGLIERVMGGEGMSASFVSVEVEADRAVIEVLLTARRFQPDPFALGFDEDSRLVLERRDGVWLVEDADWPLDECVRR